MEDTQIDFLKRSTIDLSGNDAVVRFVEQNKSLIRQLFYILQSAELQYNGHESKSGKAEALEALERARIKIESIKPKK